MTTDLKSTIEAAWENRDLIDPQDRSLKEAVEAAILRLDSGEERVAQLRAKLSRIPTRFKIDSKCDAPLLAAAAKALVAQERTRILEFFER